MFSTKFALHKQESDDGSNGVLACLHIELSCLSTTSKNIKKTLSPFAPRHSRFSSESESTRDSQSSPDKDSDDGDSPVSKRHLKQVMTDQARLNDDKYVDKNSFRLAEATLIQGMSQLNVLEEDMAEESARGDVLDTKISANTSSVKALEECQSDLKQKITDQALHNDGKYVDRQSFRTAEAAVAQSMKTFGEEMAKESARGLDFGKKISANTSAVEALEERGKDRDFLVETIDKRTKLQNEIQTTRVKDLELGFIELNGRVVNLENQLNELKKTKNDIENKFQLVLGMLEAIPPPVVLDGTKEKEAEEKARNDRLGQLTQQVNSHNKDIESILQQLKDMREYQGEAFTRIGAASSAAGNLFSKSLIL